MGAQKYFTTYLPHSTDLFYPMTERPLFSESRRWHVCIAVALCIVLLAVGCMGQPDLNNQTGTITQTPVIQTTQKSTALYKVTIAQPDGSRAEFIK
ncbi:MAG: hypothetical protein Q8R70_13530, partial [Methanoregula sp.]|nr:hypothetical protein [Methanoregula sp.]